MNFSIISAIVLFTVSVQVHNTQGCSCFFENGLQERVKELRGAILATVLSKYEVPSDGKRFPGPQTYYWVRVRSVVRGCRIPPFITYTSSAVGTSCESFLAIGLTYLLPYDHRQAIQIMTPCDITSSIKGLLKEDRKFFKSAQSKCCVGRYCPRHKCNTPLVACKKAPCAGRKAPCHKAVRCVDNYCGGCFADWYNSKGERACVSKLQTKP